MVAVRIRPMLALEAGADRCLEVLKHHTKAATPSAIAANTTVRIGGAAAGIRFSFDHVYDSSAQQCDIYNTSVIPLVQCALQGFNATCLAYGQTGSGKTFTMMGEEEEKNNHHPPTDTATAAAAAASPSPARSWHHHHHHRHNYSAAAGIIPRALKSLFDALEHEKQQQQQQFCTNNNSNNTTTTTTVYDYTVRMQFLELYGEDIRDLLCSSSSSSSSSSNDNDNNNNRLTIRDVGTTTTDEPEVI